LVLLSGTGTGTLPANWSSRQCRYQCRITRLTTTDDFWVCPFQLNDFCISKFPSDDAIFLFPMQIVTKLDSQIMFARIHYNQSGIMNTIY
jgi:hypothetical protein